MFLSRIINISLLLITISFLSIPSIVHAQEIKKDIGATCDSDDECKTDQCMGSSVAQYQDDFCVCQQNIHCAIFYEVKNNETWTCNTDGSEESFGLHFCNSSVRGPVYAFDPSKSTPFGTVLSEEELKNLTTKPTTRIGIPGLSFSDVKVVEENGKRYFSIPFLGEYIASLYTYGIALMSVIAVIMIIISGLQWVLSGGESGTIDSAKKRIGGALIGLVLAIGSYTILYSINPQLVVFKHLQVEYIQPQTVGSYVDGMVHLNDLGEINLVPITDADFHHSAPAQDYQITDQMIRDISQKTQINYCVLNTIIKKESGGKGLQVGHDENYPHTHRGDKCPAVGSRGRFLLSGLKYGGGTFTAITPPYNPCIHNNHSVGGRVVMNDDKLDLNNPPHYNLDWRFSHGIGLGQVTIYPGKSYSRLVNGPNGPEWARNQNGRWYTVTDLLNPDKTIESTLFIIESSHKNSGGSVEKLFENYAGGPGGVPRAMEYFCNCLDANPDLARVNACANY
ncbi:MAG: hypothetical protein KBD15_02260 [Candidatus Magasanikbacteria bacterium]|nr:hypothetical protein [Candidatus Magasanikbacteria bacterium]